MVPNRFMLLANVLYCCEKNNTQVYTLVYVFDKGAKQTLTKEIRGTAYIAHNQVGGFLHCCFVDSLLHKMLFLESCIYSLSDSYPAFFLPIATTSNKNF